MHKAPAGVGLQPPADLDITVCAASRKVTQCIKRRPESASSRLPIWIRPTGLGRSGF